MISLIVLISESHSSMTNNAKLDKSPSQKKAYKHTADIMKQVQAEMDKAAKEAGKEAYARLQKDHPELVGKKMHFIAGNRCLTSAEIPFKDVYLKLLDAMLFGGLDKTQVDIIREVQEKYFQDKGKISANVWNKALEPWAIANINKRVQGNMVRPIDVSKCSTLGEVKKTLKVNNSEGGAVYKYSGQIVVNKYAVMAGKASYPLMKRRKAHSIQVPISWDEEGKRQWIRLDALLSLLENLKKTRVE